MSKLSHLSSDSYELIFEMQCNTTTSYPVFFCDQSWASSPLIHGLLQKNKTILLTTPSVFRYHEQEICSLSNKYSSLLKVLVLECNEQSKSLDLVAKVCSCALEFGLSRSDQIMVIGGGVVTDIATVATSLIRRGISCLRVPTTLIGQIDAGVGVKGAVNFKGKKSCIGCFHPPRLVLIDPKFLRTLPSQHISYGLAETLKMAVIRDSELFDLVSRHSEELLRSSFQEPQGQAHRIIRLAARGMLEELQSNPFENITYKRLVDAGHTFSPLIEAASNFTIHHGNAVAIDLALSVTISVELGYFDNKLRQKVLDTLRRSGLLVYSELLTPDLCNEALEEATRHRGGAMNLVLPTAIGQAIFLERREDLPREALNISIDRLCNENN